MLNVEELKNILFDLETDRIEKTISTTDTEKFCQAICSFSNDMPNHKLPGYLVIGVNGDGLSSGLVVTDQLLQNLASLRSDGNVQPIPALNVNKYPHPNGSGEIAVVEVFPSDLPPVRYKGQVCIRVGPRKGNASEQEERILSERRTMFSRTFDVSPCLQSSLDDLSKELFLAGYRENAIAKDILDENHRSIETQMSSLRFYDLSKKCPTNAGMLLFGKNPLNWLPGAYVQFVRYDGETLSSNVVNEKKFSGDLMTVLKELDSFISLQITSSPISTSVLHEKDSQDYPDVAIREILMNALMHRDYQSNSPVRFYWFIDRIEIQNPGSLYGEATRENFPKQNAYRNPVIAEAMHVLGYVNKFGRGVDRAQDALRKNTNREAEFTFEDTYVLVVLRKKG